MTDPSARAPMIEGHFYRTWLPRAIWLTVAVLTTWAAVTWVFRAISGVLIFLAAVLFLAIAFLPGVRRLTDRGWKNSSAAALVTSVGLLIVIALMAVLLALVFAQTERLIDRIPEWAATGAAWLNENLNLNIDPGDLDVDGAAANDAIGGNLNAIIEGVVAVAGGAIGFGFILFTGATFVYYILKEERNIGATVLSFFPEDTQRQIDAVWRITLEKTGGYVYSRGLLALVSAVYHSVAFAIIDLPGPLALGLLVGFVSQFIPTVGTFIAGAIPTVIALLEDPVSAIWVILAISIYQLLENLIVQPRMTARTMEMHPAVALLATAIGARVLGALGAVIALPVTATLQAAIGTYRRRYEVIEGTMLDGADRDPPGAVPAPGR